MQVQKKKSLKRYQNQLLIVNEIINKCIYIENSINN